MSTETNKPELSWARTRGRITERLARNLPINLRLPGGGRLRIDRQLPFLLVYRSPARPDPGTAEFVTTEAAYLIASGKAELTDEVDALCRSVVATLQQHFGTVLLIEIWAANVAVTRENQLPLTPVFEIVTLEAEDSPHVAAVRTPLEQISLGGEAAHVSVSGRAPVAPPGQTPLSLPREHVANGENLDSRCICIGLAVRPIYQNVTADGVYPLILHRLRRRLSVALRQSIFELTGMATQQSQLEAHSLGPSRMRKTADRVDQQLSEFAATFDFLLQVSPANSEHAWHECQSGGCRAIPKLYYRPLPYRPSQLKRKLFAIPIEHVDDPTLAWLFSQKQVELDRQITALREIGTPAFRYSSLQLFGRPDAGLVALAESILRSTGANAEPTTDSTGRLDADEMAPRAGLEIDAYRKQQPAFEARVEVADGIAAGIMVSGDRLLISKALRIDPARAMPLLQHEVGTHLLTYFNGRSQPLRMLAQGLAHCEGLQEGLAVLAEYLSGGLSAQRMRILAARVIAIASMLEERSFGETFQRLVSQYGISARASFTTVLRAYRAGGSTKDILYLRGLQRLLSHLGTGHSLKPLYVGKIALQHVPLIQELRSRGIVRAPLLLPRFWNFEMFRTRLEGCRQKGVLDLLSESLHGLNATSKGEVE